MIAGAPGVLFGEVACELMQQNVSFSGNIIAVIGAELREREYDRGSGYVFCGQDDT
ncbi:MAG TPA: hypothetical protein VFJ48_03885 [Casimicrobiaceae bacterium]|nr:hypothetical protein [Casimicrobiaceae bacterium]